MGRAIDAEGRAVLPAVQTACRQAGERRRHAQEFARRRSTDVAVLRGAQPDREGCGQVRAQGSGRGALDIRHSVQSRGHQEFDLGDGRLPPEHAQDRQGCFAVRVRPFRAVHAGDRRRHRRVRRPGKAGDAASLRRRPQGGRNHRHLPGDRRAQGTQRRNRRSRAEVPGQAQRLRTNDVHRSQHDL